MTQEELGGSRIHTRVSGVGDLEVDSDEECIAGDQGLPVLLPAALRGAAAACASRADPVDRMDEELLDILPDSPRKPYDMYDVIGRIVDDGEWFDLKPRWARTIITCLARMGGRPVGIVANQPKHLGGILENDSADKAARFVNLCDAFGIPLLFLRTCPGFMVGTKVEQAGHHPARREDALRGLARDGAEGHGRDPQGLRRRLLRDVRQAPTSPT